MSCAVVIDTLVSHIKYKILLLEQVENIHQTIKLVLMSVRREKHHEADIRSYNPLQPTQGLGSGSYLDDEPKPSKNMHQAV